MRHILPAGGLGDAEALFFLERNRLWGRGSGYIDMHLLASVSLKAEGWLWTRDRLLREIAEQPELAHASATPDSRWRGGM